MYADNSPLIIIMYALTLACVDAACLIMYYVYMKTCRIKGKKNQKHLFIKPTLSVFTLNLIQLQQASRQMCVQEIIMHPQHAIKPNHIFTQYAY